LSTHSIFTRACSKGKCSAPVLSIYLSQERSFLQSYLRFLALLLANIALPRKPSVLVRPRVGGIKTLVSTQVKKQELDTEKKAKMGAEVANGFTGLGMGFMLGGLAGIGTGSVMKVAMGQADLKIGQDDPVREGGGAIVEEVGNSKEHVGERIADWIVSRISWVRKELDLLEEIWEDFPDISLESWEPSPYDATSQMIRLFQNIGRQMERGETSMLSALVTLWAREKVI